MSKYQFINLSIEAGIAHIELNRPEKKNAINDHLILELESVFLDLLGGSSSDVSAVVLSGAGDSFCSGLDLLEHKARTPFEVVKHSQMWHRIFKLIRSGGIPVISALHGAVIGGGLELAVCSHVRVAEPTARFMLPEGRHGIFVGGGASVHVARIIGTSRMTDMMLTGRSFNAEEGERIGLVNYLVESGQGLDKAFELAIRISENAPLSNWAMVTALSRIESMSADDGLYTESLTAGLTQSSDEAQKRISEFFERKK
ncbi:MAG: crotonase/enoyl-CoA hydratase family protein [Gammaproteobacteria bacterium]|nr:crotonase/enoyl-CoA hydratase family protein [Gammaproteobacteria bacterium]